MAELSFRERLQPSLLDRLTDNAPDQQIESREQRVLSMRQLRQSVLRDLGWLLSTTSFEAGMSAMAEVKYSALFSKRSISKKGRENAAEGSFNKDLSQFPLVARSVLNYGTPLTSGISVRGMDIVKTERKIRQAIIDFEPRLLPQSLVVKLVAEEGNMSQRAVFFTIEGELWAQPLPIHLFIRSSFDLETGEVTIKDMGS